jgi:hypothetical protein
MRYLIDFHTVPGVGAKLTVYNHRGVPKRLTLECVDDPWRACDIVLHWRDENGARFTSGLRSRTLHRVSS